MSDSFLVGLLVGLFTGGCTGAIGMAVVAAGSEQRVSRDPREFLSVADVANASAQQRRATASSMRVDLLLDLYEVKRYSEPRRAEDDDIEQDRRDPVPPYGMPP